VTTLRLAPGLTLPLNAVTQRFGFIGRVGSGKSYAATKLAELMLDAGAQVVALDPVGVWYGLRVDGKGKGYPIPVFGGLHGDVPLEVGAGALIADLVVDRALSCVIDVSQFESDRDKARFAAAFASRFFFRKKAAPSAVQLFMEECQEFVPQNPQKGEEQMLHDFTRMAKLGRNFGIGVSLITQRPQEVNKKVLNLTECLFAFQMTGVHERKAVRDWVSAKGADEDIVALLPTLKEGVAHVYSPQWLGVSQQAKAYEKQSADVSSTPEVGASAVHSKPLAPVDLAALREKMAATLEKAKQEDPRELRKRIAELERAAKSPGKTVEKPVVDQRAIERAVATAVRAERDRADGLRVAFGRLLRTMGAFAESVTKEGGGMRECLSKYEDALAQSEAELGGTAGRPEAGARPTAAGREPAARRPTVPTPRALAAIAQSNGDLSRGQQRILNALAELDALGVPAPTRHQLGMVAGYNLTGGTGAQHVADLGSKGYTESSDGRVTLTDKGRAHADDAGVPTTLVELHERVLAKLPDGQRRIAEYLISIHPEAISRADLGRAVNYNLTGGTGAQHVADLVTVGAAKIPGAGRVVASDLLFPDGLN
jgi:hypothetical protein